MNDRYYVMEVKINGEWRVIQPAGRKENPYVFTSLPQAEWMLRICYPDQVRDIRLGGEPEVRVSEVDEDWLFKRGMVQADLYPPDPRFP